LPMGGHEYGHKGYGLALTIESLSQGLSGHGGADGPTRWGAAVYLQLMDPAAFGGAVRPAGSRTPAGAIPPRPASRRCVCRAMGRTRASVRR
jgi:hypothetical protein